MSSAAKAKLGALYTTAKEMVPLQQTLIKNVLAPAMHSHPNYQLCCHWCHQCHHCATESQVHGLLLMVAPLLRVPRAIYYY